MPSWRALPVLAGSVLSPHTGMQVAAQGSDGGGAHMTGGKQIGRARSVAHGGRQPRSAAEPARQGTGNVNGLSRAALCGGMVVAIAAAFWIVLGLEELRSRGTIGLPGLLDTRALEPPGCTSFAIDRASGA